ncbi:hypothetical protein [Paractinoplanes lichenicola]|uniref:Transposase n=1 Tax=Paractinoplanes lichenicola TaxID=2802976 RepID=A0ABS1VLR3_9ACTN|nr:hypothetical protein [Actinoplanes lichenicola]MBL7255588.1 hypothetical protein [Actinoplanes lichenicola]
MSTSRRSLTHPPTDFGSCLEFVVVGWEVLVHSPDRIHPLLTWVHGFGRARPSRVEGTGAYGAGLADRLRVAQVKVIEIDRPRRNIRRSPGKSDPIDAATVEAAKTALAADRTGTPKHRDGRVEAIAP